jgi:hypothetical protein
MAPFCPGVSEQSTVSLISPQVFGLFGARAPTRALCSQSFCSPLPPVKEMTTQPAPTFAEKICEMQRQSQEAFTSKQAQEDERVIPPFVERVKAAAIKHATGPSCFYNSFEWDNFTGLNDRQRMRAKAILENKENKLVVHEDDYDGKRFWSVSWAKE